MVTFKSLLERYGKLSEASKNPKIAALSKKKSEINLKIKGFISIIKARREDLKKLKDKKVTQAIHDKKKQYRKTIADYKKKVDALKKQKAPLIAGIKAEKEKMKKEREAKAKK